MVRYKPKAKIAKEVHDTVQSLGGRFLKPVEEHEENNKEQETEDDEKWIEVDKKTSLEKCKQVGRDCVHNHTCKILNTEPTLSTPSPNRP